VAADHSDGFSIWASVKIAPQFDAFARYDGAKPSTDLAPALKDEYFNLGVDYKARKNVDIALAYKVDKVTGGTTSTGNGSIGGTRDGEYKEFGLWALVAF
jgi:predicted porin